eukprot:1692161-Alexandrium_andersonii.AAC.1
MDDRPSPGQRLTSRHEHRTIRVSIWVIRGGADTEFNAKGIIEGGGTFQNHGHEVDRANLSGCAWTSRGRPTTLQTKGPKRNPCQACARAGPRRQQWLGARCHEQRGLGACSQ